jgi:hypothetical protein
MRHHVELLNNPVQGTATRVISALLNSPSKRIPLDKFREIVIAVPDPKQQTDAIASLRSSEVFFINDYFVTFQSVGGRVICSQLNIYNIKN